MDSRFPRLRDTSDTYYCPVCGCPTSHDICFQCNPNYELDEDGVSYRRISRFGSFGWIVLVVSIMLFVGFVMLLKFALG